MLSTRTKGQTTLEVVILIGFVTAALIAMGVYMKRGIQGRLRESTDQVGEQYSAKYVNSDYDVDTNTVQGFIPQRTKLINMIRCSAKAQLALSGKARMKIIRLKKVLRQ
jgi:Flp pilus assembly pilin Flp